MGDPLQKGDTAQELAWREGKNKSQVPGGLHEKRGNSGAEKPGQPLT